METVIEVTTLTDLHRATVQQFVNHGILVIPPVPGGPKPPASVVRTSEDKKQVILSM